METSEKIRLEKLYHDLSDTALGDMIAQPPDSYQPGVYALLRAEADKRGLPEQEPVPVVEVPSLCSNCAEQPLHAPRFVAFMSVETKDDLMFVEGVFKTAQIPFRIEESADKPGSMAVMVEEGWLAQAGELFREE